MRMIDANALKTSFEEDGHLSNYIEEFIDNAPTIEYEPERHGRWIWDEVSFNHTCSVCKCPFDYSTTYGLFDHGFADASYCPSCGAKMDGDDENAHEV